MITSSMLWVGFAGLTMYLYVRKFLNWHETKTQFHLRLLDTTQNWYAGWDYSQHIGGVVYLSVAWALAHVSDWVPVSTACAHLMLLVWCRMVCLYVVPLREPDQAIPLRDYLLERFVGRILQRSLLFSGHVASLCYLAYLCPTQSLVFHGAALWISWFFLSQKCHYAMDLLVAPMAVAWTATLVPHFVTLVNQIPLLFQTLFLCWVIHTRCP